MPDRYRGLYKDDESAGEAFASHVKDAIERALKRNRAIAAFFCESLLSCGGQIVLPKNYLRTAYEHVREAGGVCIADEVQIGSRHPALVAHVCEMCMNGDHGRASETFGSLRTGVFLGREMPSVHRSSRSCVA